MFSDAQLLQLAIATPLVAAVIIACGLPKRFAVKLAAAALTVPALLALWLRAKFPAVDPHTHSFISTTHTGLGHPGISLQIDRKSTPLNSSQQIISHPPLCL